ncbi:hypothetical protein FLL83_17790 [Vibrio cholerae]|uniref:hypothetical protein n=1 Tax=Vibrio cholerae TaxID=666 RepID=UPI001158BFF1|nr:hypothetical protein [Vibrio cholerae]TQQ58954.1 hypothetical protein FLL83_17790 [Vibrio cholerae]HDZ9496694.1 hypothetical protein [Vibrio cholerae]
MKKVIILLVLVPLFFPLVIKSYLAFAPGEMVGNVDGWLGFLGGYLGGLLAFFSAYMIFKNQRSENVRPYLITDTKAFNEKTEYCLYFIHETEGLKIDAATFKTNVPSRDDKLYGLCLKNVGNGPALDIELRNDKQKASLADVINQTFQEYSSIGTIEVSNKESWFYCFDINKEYQRSTVNEDTLIEELTLYYKDIYGKEYVQKLHFSCNRPTGKGGLSTKI